MDAYDRALAYAAERGTEDGQAAASWYFDGNTSDATYAAVLQGIEDGDPVVLDTLPSPDLSGQWADSLTGPNLVERAWRAAGLGDLGALFFLDDGPAPDGTDGFRDICGAYESAYSTAVEDVIAQSARRMLA